MARQDRQPADAVAEAALPEECRRHRGPSSSISVTWFGAGADAQESGSRNRPSIPTRSLAPPVTAEAGRVRDRCPRSTSRPALRRSRSRSDRVTCPLRVASESVGLPLRTVDDLQLGDALLQVGAAAGAADAVGPCGLKTALAAAIATAQARPPLPPKGPLSLTMCLSDWHAAPRDRAKVASHSEVVLALVPGAVIRGNPPPASRRNAAQEAPRCDRRLRLHSDIGYP